MDDYLVAKPLYDPYRLAPCVKQARDRLALRRWLLDITASREGSGDVQASLDVLEQAT